MPRQSARPSYKRHKATGTAYTRIEGKVVSLGKWDSPESRSRFRELLEAWSIRQEAADFSLTVDDLCLRYLPYVDAYYVKDGQPTCEAANIRQALRPLVRLFGSLRVREFGPRKLVAVRDEMIRLGFVRTNINRHVSRIKSMFKWGVGEERLPASTHHALTAVAGLKAGRSAAKESPPVRPVAWDQVEAVQPHVSRQVWGAIRLQWLTGMRSQEVLAMRGCDLVMSGQIWEYEPETHKTACRRR